MKYRLAPSDYNDWLQDRRDHPSIGASMSPAIMGLSPWQTAVDVWDTLVHGIATEEDNLAMYLGREMEGIVKKLFMDHTGLKVVNDYKIRIDEEHEFLTTNLDGMVIGEGVPVEYKTTAKPWDGEIPDSYFVQLQHQMMVTETDYIYYCSLSMGFRKQLIVEKYNRNDQFIDDMRTQLINFWDDHVLTKKPPEAKSLSDAKKIFNHSDPEAIATASYDDYQQIIELQNLKKHRDLIDTQIKDKKLQVMKTMGERETMVSDSGHELVTWRKTKDSNIFDSKQLLKDKPDIYNNYLKTRDGYRRFVLKKTEEDNERDNER
jgi:putative phage-type endonuclease